MHKQLLAFILILIFFCANQVFAQEVVTGDITQNLEPEMREGMKSLQPWMADAQAVKFGPYKIYRPNDETSPKIWINGPRSEQLVSIDKNQVVIGSDTGTVGTDDRDGDGLYETVTYDILGTNGKVSGTVYDWNRDGDIDMKVFFSGVKDEPAKVFVMLSGQWGQISKKDGRLWVATDDKDIEVKKVGLRYIPVD